MVSIVLCSVVSVDSQNDVCTGRYFHRGIDYYVTDLANFVANVDCSSIVE